ncbi:MAG: AbrB/MazE/SpoVT family DNA-binding domain-containing protein [Planctomycetota bacterium]|nr:MAG: AbrB/MazE/SpoVT family DNA-binding domain-containing protein [Planctomycetota bacterium]REJ91726.1 MAG: AbrB/MazE/SpoVT family DNA-binding domain-containing protein [Planctomycetota bacterium]REK20900.1 MAG: AbrB/MazE/SpoVT family DNA-binding domain-containing protein [Planctomycetota bacterium]REK27456.1 MAG: AbrB/MazE/SpoVT family DNA-binding domain-containing protein [Planctomycetota bacterium]
MIKTLTKHGNSLALVIEKPILELLGIDADTPLEVTTDGTNLKVSPVTDVNRREKFQAALAKTNRKYGKVLKKLAE